MTSETATDDNSKTKTFFEVIEEIWELEYSITKIPMFRVRWTKGESHGFRTMVLPPEIPREQVDVTKIPAREEPWVFAKQCKQVFYIDDPANKGRVVVRRGKRSIVGVDGVTSQENYEGFHDPTTVADDEEVERTILTRKRRGKRRLDGSESKKIPQKPYVRSSTARSEVMTYRRKEKA